MIYFIFIFGYFLLTLHQDSKNDKNVSIYIYYWVALFIAVVIGLRGNEDEYTRVYLLIPTLNEFNLANHPVIQEKGLVFSFIASLFKSLSLNSQSIFLFFSFASIFLHAIFYRKYTKYYFLAFLLYLSHEICFKEWVGIRMGLASAMLLPMIYYLLKGHKIKFLLLVIIATLIQYVAILSTFLIFLNRRINPTYLWFGLIASVLILESGIVFKVMWYLDENEILPTIISSYLRAESYVYDVGLAHFKTVQQILTVSLLIIVFGYKKHDLPECYNLLFNAYYLGTVFLIIFSEFALFAFRFGGHFYTVEPILITYFVLAIREKKLAANLIAVASLGVAYLNYVYLERVSPYDLFVNYPN